MNQNVLVGLVLVAVLGIGGALVTKDSVITVNSPVTVESPAGQSFAGSGADSFSLAEFFGGFQISDNYATTTPASATLSAKETAGFSTVSFYPSVGDVTITLAASSTLGALLGPGVGTMKRVCYYNATTTTGIDITLASGTGVDLEVASSTETDVGTASLKIFADASACIEYQKKSSSVSTAANRNDITARLTRFVDGD